MAIVTTLTLTPAKTTAALLQNNSLIINIIRFLNFWSSDENLCKGLQIAELFDEQRSSKLLHSPKIEDLNLEDNPFQFVRQKRPFKSSKNCPKTPSDLDEKQPKKEKIW